MRKLNVKRVKRAGALALATVMLAGALALPASAAADANYLWDLHDMLEQNISAQELMEKYPNSPEAVFWYAQWNQDELARTGQLIPYLDRVISLGLATDRPYQAKWVYGEDGRYPSNEGDAEEVDYTRQAAEMKAQYEMWTLGHQEQAINAEQQYLDCWDRWDRIHLSYLEQDMQEYRQYLKQTADTRDTADEVVGEEENYRKYMIEEDLEGYIPRNRRELDSIRQWYTSGASSFDAGQWTGESTVHVEGAKGSQNVSLHRLDGSTYKTTNITSPTPILGIQRTLDAVTIFVPAGTEVTITTENQAYDDPSDRSYDEAIFYTATMTAYEVDRMCYFLDVYIVGV